MINFDHLMIFLNQLLLAPAQFIAGFAFAFFAAFVVMLAIYNGFRGSKQSTMKGGE